MTQPGSLTLRYSSLLARVAPATALLFLIGNWGIWCSPDLAGYAARGMSGLFTETLVLTPRARVLGAVISTLHIALISYALWVAGRLFAAFARGEVFVPGTGQGLRKLGIALLLFAVLKPLVRTLMGLAVSIDNPPGQRMLTIGFAGDEVIIALVAMLLILIGHALHEATLIAEEHRQFI